MGDTSSHVERALQAAMADLDDLHITSPHVSRATTIEFWRGLAERATERADCVQEELDEHGESEPPSEPGSLSGDEDDEEDGDEDED